MSGHSRGLRLRLLAIVLAAALVPMAPLSILLLLQVRDALYARRVADARGRIATAASAARTACGPGGDEAGSACAARAARVAGAQLIAGPCQDEVSRVGDRLVVCAAVPGGALELREDLGPVREQLARLDRRLLLTLLLFVAALVAIAASLLDRGIVRRLALVDTALEAVGAEQDARDLLPEGGDAVGRVGAAVNRLSGRLREERQRTRSQIGQLETVNAEIRAAREEVARSERLASVGRLAAGVAHEVGNPVSALIAYAAIMRERLAAGQDIAEYVVRVEREAVRIDRILRDLLDLARPREGRLGAVELDRAVAVARASLEPQQAWSGVTLTAPAGLPAVLAEEHYLVQVLVNLLANAGRAGAKQVRLSARSDGAQVLLEVEDDGAGIPPEALARLFEPFFTTSAPGEGTGLGLALCHATMERFGGGISARNREGQRGAVFTLRFVSAPAARS